MNNNVDGDNTGLSKVSVALDSIQRLLDALKSLEGGPVDSSPTTTSSSSPTTTSSSSSSSSCSCCWGHWRVLSPELIQTYDWLHSGAELIKAVCTKFTLISAMDVSQAGHLVVCVVVVEIHFVKY